MSANLEHDSGMSQPNSETVDAIVVGGNLSGLVTAYLLGHLGYRSVVLERSARIGGANASFTTPDGSTFDLGMHVLDYMRSELTTRLFTHVMGGKVNRVPLKRGMVLRGQAMPYNPIPSDMPEELRKLLPDGELKDDLGTDLPTRERLRKYYGKYSDFIFDEVLPSYRCEQRHKDLGVEEARLLTNIYPWMFPRSQRSLVTGQESRAFHDRLRRGEEQYILYPTEGGFASFANAFLEKLRPNVEVLTDIPDLHFELEPGTHRINWLRAKGRQFESRHIFWCAAWPSLCQLLNIPVQNLATDNMLLGSFRFSEPADSEYNELLIGDPSFHIDRISFPGKFAQTNAPLLQLEFAFPVAHGSLPLELQYWQQKWLSDLKRLGLLGDRHKLETFDFRNFRMHYNSFGAEGQECCDADPSLLMPESNIHPVAPTMQNRNINGSVPLYLQQVTRVLAEHP
ncbi:MAG: NAD(P)-binding protein [Deltaproteobacteria bacterium]|nr:NAD(P)-binding protein [Deltaproteobacteria bacterium]